MTYQPGPRTRAEIAPATMAQGDADLWLRAAWQAHVAAGRIGGDGTGAAPAERGLASLVRLLGRERSGG